MDKIKKLKVTVSVLLLLTLFAGMLTGCITPLPEEPSEIPPATSEEPLSIELPNEKLNLLTGEYDLKKSEYGKRPIAVMVNNIKIAWPQAGIGNADLLYEMEVEGGITRLLAVFSSLERIPDKLGSVRSMRPYYINLAGGHNAIYVGHGWSGRAKDLLANQKLIDFINGDVHGKAFFRDAAKGKQKGREHSSYTTREKLESVAKELKLNTELEEKWQDNTFLNFRAPDNAKAVGNPCETLKVPFSKYATSVFTYDVEKKVYFKSEFSEKHIDETTGKQLAFTNVLVLFMPVSMEDSKHLAFDFSASGPGFYASNGKIQEIKWGKGWNVEEPFKFRGADGKGMTANAGRTMVCIVRTTQEDKLSYE